MAYWLVASGLALIGVIASIVVSVKEREEEAADQQAAKTDTEAVVSDATAQALAQTPIALIGAVMTMPGSAVRALSAARVLGRNWPLVLLLAMIGALFWPSEHPAEDKDKMACRRLGLIDEACKHGSYAFQIAPRTKPTAAANARVAIG